MGQTTQLSRAISLKHSSSSRAPCAGCKMRRRVKNTRSRRALITRAGGFNRSPSRPHATMPLLICHSRSRLFEKWALVVMRRSDGPAAVARCLQMAGDPRASPAAVTCKTGFGLSCNCRRITTRLLSRHHRRICRRPTTLNWRRQIGLITPCLQRSSRQFKRRFRPL